jgi:hypothetical protein
MGIKGLQIDIEKYEGFPSIWQNQLGEAIHQQLAVLVRQIGRDKIAVPKKDLNINSKSTKNIKCIFMHCQNVLFPQECRSAKVEKIQT